MVLSHNVEPLRLLVHRTAREPSGELIEQGRRRNRFRRPVEINLDATVLVGHHKVPVAGGR